LLRAHVCICVLRFLVFLDRFLLHRSRLCISSIILSPTGCFSDVCDCNTCPESLEDDNTCDLARSTPYLDSYTDENSCECCQVSCQPCTPNLSIYQEGSRCAATDDTATVEGISTFEACVAEAQSRATSTEDYFFGYKADATGGKCRLPADATSSQTDCVDNAQDFDAWTVYQLTPDCVASNLAACGSPDHTQYKKKRMCPGAVKYADVESEYACAFEAWSMGKTRFGFFSKKSHCYIPQDDDCESVEDATANKKKWVVYDLEWCEICTTVTGELKQEGAKCKKQEEQGSKSLIECAELANEIGASYFSMKNGESCWLPTENGVLTKDEKQCITKQVGSTKFNLFEVVDC